MDSKIVIPISEIFYSIQGEGVNSGVPALFIRVSGCNLKCVWCDTKYAWSNGELYTVEELINLIQEFNEFLTRRRHLVITGGEPLLWQKQLSILLGILKSKYTDLFVEVETNGTIKPIVEFDNYVSQYNVSLKLSNSMIPEHERLIPEAIEWFKKSGKAYFKFVVLNEKDVEEILSHPLLEDIISKHRDRVLFMPLASTREEYLERAPLVIELSKKYGVRFSPRIHICIYSGRRGV